MHGILVSHMRATCFDLIILDLITPIFLEECTLWSRILCSFLHPNVTCNYSRLLLSP